jgi:AcrR family transcriptional regulator
MEKMIELKKRKPPAERRGEIIAAASAVALAEGLDSLTLRRVADELGVVPGLVNHYFPAVDELVAAAFAHAAAAERDEIFGGIAALRSPVARMAALLRMVLSESQDNISLLWLDAWQASRRLAVLRTEVSVQMLAWQTKVAGLIGEGVAAGVFEVEDAGASAARIMALIDGISVHAATRGITSYGAVREMVVAVTARELGLPAGVLG